MIRAREKPAAVSNLSETFPEAERASKLGKTLASDPPEATIRCLLHLLLRLALTVSREWEPYDPHTICNHSFAYEPTFPRAPLGLLEMRRKPRLAPPIENVAHHPGYCYSDIYIHRSHAHHSFPLSGCIGAVDYARCFWDWRLLGCELDSVFAASAGSGNPNACHCQDQILS